jgi:hypothetical protein
MKNSRIQGTSIPSLLSEIHSIVSDYKEERNVIVHKRTHVEKRLSEVELMHKAAEETELEFPGALKKQTTDEFARQKKGEFEEVLSSIRSHIFELFDELERVFRAHVPSEEIAQMEAQGE